ncbi:hypothetical protein [Vibrio parahaemolyticus]|uniref:hypothetical protein n=2 Tax=Vibrio TaxID=662 RepID=UPI0018A15B35|nr:hypothetical protein [Vibrio parahaemolyticus]EJT0908917.1 hypothetical protein [Vibrio parahaemolyticus]
MVKILGFSMLCASFKSTAELLRELTMEFIFPYIQILTLAARQLVQLYETVTRGSVQIFTSGSLTYHVGMGMIILSLLIVISLVVSVYTIYKKTGWSGICVYSLILSIPGLVTLYDPQWVVGKLMKRHHFEAGGSPYSDGVGDLHGLISLLVIVLFFGWSIFLHLQVILNDKKVKSLIDHIWYPSGLVLAAAFLLMQGDEAKKWGNQNELELDFAKRAETILNQNRIALNYLRSNEIEPFLNEYQAKLLEDYFVRSVSSFRMYGPVSGVTRFSKSDDIFGASWSETKLLLDQINTHICSGSSVTLECHHWTLRDFELTNGKLEPFDPPVIIPYQYFDVLNGLSEKIEISLESFRDHAPSKAVRLLIFCVLAMFAGAKISTATYVLLPSSNAKDRMSSSIRTNDKQKGSKTDSSSNIDEAYQQ